MRVVGIIPMRHIMPIAIVTVAIVKRMLTAITGMDQRGPITNIVMGVRPGRATIPIADDGITIAVAHHSMPDTIAIGRTKGDTLTAMVRHNSPGGIITGRIMA